MTIEPEKFEINDVPIAGRAPLEGILAESFEGWYLTHSRRTLSSIEVVREAIIDGRPAGLVMLKTLGDFVGYVFYIAVARDYRRKKVGTRLLDHSLDYFSSLKLRDVYASVEEGNAESAGLFKSRGFSRTSYREVARRYGPLRALDLYRRMLVVPGEVLLFKPLVPNELGQRTA